MNEKFPIGKIVFNMMPAFVKNKIYSACTSILQRYWKDKTKHVPLLQLDSNHVENAKIIADRYKMLELMPKDAIIAEIGVNRGGFSERILEICKPKKLHLVDVWGSKRYGNNLKVEVQNKFKNEIQSGLVEINLGYSTVVADEFEDDYFDWVYIDTDHTYETTKLELEKYSKKVKPNGVMAGHDYIIGNWNMLDKYGVIEAVHEFCVNYGWEIIYLTTDINISPSFAIKKK